MNESDFVSNIENTRFNKNKTRYKIFAEVFDKRTTETLHKMANKKVFDRIDKMISTGKEANIFLAYKNDLPCIIKIYRIETSSFDNLRPYIENDIRFRNIKSNKHNLIFEWTKKEFKNLKAAYEKGVNVPYPIYFENNIIVMEMIGQKQPAKTLKELKDMNKITQIQAEKIITQIVNNLHKLVYDAEIVHADLSEYNILLLKNKVYFIDMAQAVHKNSVNAKTFYTRDINNVVRFFNRFGLNLNEQELKTRIKN